MADKLWSQVPAGKQGMGRARAFRRAITAAADCCQMAKAEGSGVSCSRVGCAGCITSEERLARTHARAHTHTRTGGDVPA